MRVLGSLAESAPRELAVIRDLACPGPAGDIPLRLYDPRETREAGPCVIFIHGGGFVIGDLEVYHALCTEIAHQLDLPVVSVDYRHEVRRGESEDEIIGHVAHRIGHHLDQAAVVGDRPCRLAVGPASQEEEQEESGDEALVEWRQACLGGGCLVDQRGARAQREHQPQRDHEQYGKARPAQTFALAVGQRAILLRFGFGIAAHRRGPFAQAWLDDLVGYVPDHRQEHERHRHDEVPVTRDIGRENAEHAFDRGLGDAEQQRIELTWQEIGGKAARYAREGGRDARHRMAPGGMEDDARQRDQHDIGGIGGEIPDHPHQRHDRRQEYDGGITDARTHRGAEQARPLCNAGAEHDHQHVTERVEMGERRRHLDPQAAYVLRRQQ
ncbi:alpha/beta hydrolase fold domain-containing protein [Leptolyngbya sp. 15MV]|nr:alpha/beta hydrolase fold domain-containing protein [Leptolyngbya sp. 15MV]